jgi:hypothetical protein
MYTQARFACNHHVQTNFPAFLSAAALMRMAGGFFIPVTLERGESSVFFLQGLLPRPDERVVRTIERRPEKPSPACALTHRRNLPSKRNICCNLRPSVDRGLLTLLNGLQAPSLLFKAPTSPRSVCLNASVLSLSTVAVIETALKLRSRR